MQKKILLVNKMYYPEIGGIETVVKQYSEWLVEAGNDVTVLTANRSNKFKTFTEQINGVKIIRSSSFAFGFSMPLSFTIFFKFLKIYRKYDIIHFHEPYPLGTLMSLVTSKKTRIIITWHSDIIKQKGILKNFVVYLQKKSLDKATIITTTSQKLLNSSDFINKYKYKTKIIPLSTVRLNSIQYNFSSYFLVIGRISYYKGIEYLIEAFNIAAPIKRRLLIAGKGDNKIENKIIELVKKHKNVEFINDFVSETKKIKLIEECYCLLFPSCENSEAFGITQIEALSAGKPIINTKLDTGVPWVSLDNVTGFTAKPKNPESFAEKLVEMDNLSLNNYKELCDNASERFESNFVDEKVKIKLIKIYNEK